MVNWVYVEWWLNTIGLLSLLSLYCDVEWLIVKLEILRRELTTIVFSAPLQREDKNGQWMGVSVSSQGTPDGKAVVRSPP